METLQSLDLSTPKARQILEGAKSVFLERGYEGTSVEEIARRAQVSKGTIYNYFPDKQTLFAAVVHGECQKQSQRIFEIDRNGEDIETLLRDIALHFVEFSLSPFAQNVFRIVIAEAPRFPELGQAFYDSGPALGKKRLGEFLAQAVKDGKLAIADADLEIAADQFMQLCKVDLFSKHLLCIQPPPTQSEIQRVADSAVATFLKAFGE
jgi:TetR/AcrR family transcriptional repressor of mexJK operon